MPSILEQLAEQMKLARRGMEGDDDVLTRHPVRLFTVKQHSDERARLLAQHPGPAPADVLEQQYSRRLGDMGNLMRTIRDDPQYQSGLNIVIPQESALSYYPMAVPAGHRDYLQSVPRARHKQTVSELRAIASPHMLTAYHGNYSKPFDPADRDRHYDPRERDYQQRYAAAPADWKKHTKPSPFLEALRAGPPIGDLHKSSTSLLGGGTEIARYGKYMHAGEYIPPGEHYLSGNPQWKFSDRYHATNPAGYKPVVSDDMREDMQKLMGLSVCADFGDCSPATPEMLAAHAHKPTLWALQSDSVRPTRRDWQTGVHRLVQSDPFYNEGLMKVSTAPGQRAYDDAVPAAPHIPFGSLQYQQYTMTPEMRDRFGHQPAKNGGRIQHRIGKVHIKHVMRELKARAGR